MRRLIRKILIPPLIILAALFFIFEEWLWEWLRGVTAAIARLPFIAAIEPWIARQGPTVAIAILVGSEVPVISLKILVVLLWAHGWLFWGTVLLLAVTLTATAVMVRLLFLTRPALLQVKLFAWIYYKILAWKDAIHEALKRLPLWQKIMAWKQHFREYIRTRRPHWIALLRRATFRFWKRRGT